MFKGTLVRTVAQDTRLHPDFVQEVVDATLEAVSNALKRGDVVVLPGFGTFYTRHHVAGQVRHIRTGAVMEVPARRQAAFRPAEALKQAVRTSRRAA